MVKPARKGILIVGTLVVFGLGISGCSGPSQSKAAACSTLIASLDRTTTHLNNGISTLSADPTGAEKSLGKGATDLHATAIKVTNPEVSKVAASADTAVTALTTQVITQIESNGSTNTKTVAALSTAVSASFADIRQLCG